MVEENFEIHSLQVLQIDSKTYAISSLWLKKILKFILFLNASYWLEKIHHTLTQERVEFHACWKKRPFTHYACKWFHAFKQNIFELHAKKGPTCNHADPWGPRFYDLTSVNLLIYESWTNILIFPNSRTNISIFPNSRKIFRLFPNPEQIWFPKFPNGKKTNSRTPWGALWHVF